MMRMSDVGVVAGSLHEAMKHIRWKCTHARSVEIRGRDVLINGSRHFVVTTVRAIRGRDRYRLEFIGRFYDRADLGVIRDRYWQDLQALKQSKRRLA